MTIADLWLDPMCPYTWITSRWLLEVERVRQVEVRWNVLSLAVLNEGRDDDPEDDPEGFLWLPARICAAVQQTYGQAALGKFYTAFGTRVYERGEFDQNTFPAALADAGLPPELAGAAESSEYDAAVRASHEAGIGLIGVTSVRRSSPSQLRIRIRVRPASGSCSSARCCPRSRAVRRPDGCGTARCSSPRRTASTS